MLKILIAVFGLLFVFSIIIHKLFVSKIKDNMKISHFLALIAILMALYIVFGIIYSIKTNILFLLFALSPFIIGRFATYEKEKLYSFIQILCILLSVVILFV